MKYTNPGDVFFNGKAPRLEEQPRNPMEAVLRLMETDLIVEESLAQVSENRNLDLPFWRLWQNWDRYLGGALCRNSGPCSAVSLRVAEIEIESDPKTEIEREYIESDPKTEMEREYIGANDRLMERRKWNENI